MTNIVRSIRIPAALAVIVAMLAGTFTPVNATAPSKEKVEYLGNGQVEIEFVQDVNYKKPKVTVKDNSGKKYTASILKKDSDDLHFRIKNYKAGRSYTFTVKGVRVKRTSKYGSVTAVVNIPAPAAPPADTAKAVTASDAKSIAISDAASKWGISRNSVYDLDVEGDTYKDVKVWEVDFEAGRYEYEYKISKADGSILKYSRERD